jgi:drug/metabolite transporter (DMT)-like permease
MMLGRLRLDRTLTLWALLLLSDTAAQLFLKLGSASLVGRSFGPDWLLHAAGSPWVLGGLGCYVGSFLLWMLILNRTALSLAFPITALVYVSVLLASRFALGETIDLWRCIGIAVIVSGVFVLGGEEA